MKVAIPLLAVLCTVQAAYVDVFAIVNGDTSEYHSVIASNYIDLDFKCQTDKTLVYAYSSQTSLHSSQKDKIDEGVTSTASCDVFLTCLGASYDMKVKNVQLLNGKAKQNSMDETFAKVFQYTQPAGEDIVSILNDASETVFISNFKKSIVESLQLQKRVTTGVSKGRATNSVGLHELSAAAVIEKASGMIIIEERFADSDFLEFSPAATARPSDLDTQSMRRVTFDQNQGFIKKSEEKVLVRYTKNASKDLGTEQIKAVVTATLVFKETVARISGVIEKVGQDGLVSDTLLAKVASEKIKRRSFPDYETVAGLSNDHLVRHLLPRANDLESSQVTELIKEIATVSDADRAGILFMILASSGQESAHEKLIEIASSPSQKLSEAAKTSLIFSSDASEKTTRLAASKLDSLVDLPIISSLLANQSPALAAQLIRPYIAQLKTTQAPAQIVQAINGLSNLKERIDVVVEDILPYITANPSSETVRASAVIALGPINCRYPAVQDAFAGIIASGSDDLAKSALSELSKSQQSCKSTSRSNDLYKAVFTRAKTSRDSELIQSAKLYLSSSGISPSLARRQLLRRVDTANDTADAWVRQGELYDLIETLEERQRDVSLYSIHTSYLWAKEFGTPDMSARVLTGMFAGTNKLGCNASEIKTFARLQSDVRAFNTQKDLIDIKILAANDDSKFNGAINVKVLGNSVLYKNIEALCTETNQPLVSYPVYIGRAAWSYPIKGFALSLDIGVTAVLRASVAYSICFKDTASASAALLADFKVIFSGKASAIFDLNGEKQEGGLKLEGSVNYSVGPTTSIGQKTCALSCISLRYGNERSNFNVMAYLKSDSWIIKNYAIAPSRHDKACIAGGSVDVNGKDPNKVEEVPSPYDYPYYLWSLE